MALKHLCNKFEVSRCWGHGTQDTRKLRSLKKCRTALQAELFVTIQLLFWKEEPPCTAAGFCVRCQKKERAAWCLCLRWQWQLSPFVLGVKCGKSSLCTALTPYSTVVTSLRKNIIEQHCVLILRDNPKWWRWKPDRDYGCTQFKVNGTRGLYILVGEEKQQLYQRKADLQTPGTF